MPLTMTLSGIVDNQQIDAADVTTPLNQIKTFVDGLETSLNTEISTRTTAVSNLRNGVDAFTQLSLGTMGSTLTIASDAIAITQSRHQIDTEGGAATDNLSTITGFAPGDLLFIQTTSAARVVTIKHGVGNIFIFTLSDIILDSPTKVAAFLYDGVTAKWCSLGNTQPVLQIRELLNTTQTSTPVLSVPDRAFVVTGYGAPRLDLVPGITTSHRVTVRSSGATVQSDLAAITVSGTPTASNQADSSYTNLTSAATAANAAGWVTTYDQLQRRYNPSMEMILRTPSTFPAARFLLGFFSAAPGNNDDPAGAMIGLRYSTVLGDSGWKIVMDDSTTMTVHGVDLAPYTPDTPYLFRIRVDGSGGGVAYFSVNNGAEIAVTAGMVGASVNLGFGMLAYTNAAVSKNFLFRSAFITWA